MNIDLAWITCTAGFGARCWWLEISVVDRVEFDKRLRDVCSFGDGESGLDGH